jgi:hypothetical protein
MLGSKRRVIDGRLRYSRDESSEVSIRGRLARAWVRPRAAIHGGDALAHTGSRPRRKIFPLSIRSSLVAVVLIPLAMSVGLASTVILHQSSLRQTAVTARQYSLVLDSLLRARIDVYAEYVPTAAIQAANQYHVSAAVLDSLLGINVKEDLVDARRVVNHLAIFGRSGMFAANFVQLTAVRRRIDDGSATRGQAEAFFNDLDLKIDARWNALDRVLDAGDASDSFTTRERLEGLGSTFSAFHVRPRRGEPFGDKLAGDGTHDDVVARRNHEPYR